MADGAEEENEKIPSCKGNVDASSDFIRQGYKYYKRKKPPPDFSEVIDFNDPETFLGRVSELPLQTFPHAGHGLRCALEWKVYQLLSCPGFIFIINPFLKGAQNYWTKRCIEDFTRKPNVSNLDAHMTIKEDESVWELSRNGQHQDLMSRLRWVHLGYQFDYNVVDYKPEHYFGFPDDLSGLMQQIAEAIGYPGYTPEAGIINYYPIGTSMGGHTDHYELDLSWPLISLSFGQPAVFLIGGKTRDIKPTGYGNVPPKTAGGKIFCIFFMLIGIPVNIILLQRIGEHVLNRQKFMIRKIELYVFKKEPQYIPEKSLLLCFLFIWGLVFLAAGVQMHEENWSFLDGVYCFIVTFTTVGFGDLIPGYHESKRGLTGIRIIWPCFIYLGLCSMSNLINCAVDCIQSQRIRKLIEQRKATVGQSLEEPSQLADRP